MAMSHADSCLITGCAALLLGGAVFAAGLVRRRGCVRLEGAVVDHEVSEDDGTTYHRPIVEYAAPDGTKHRVLFPAAFPKPRPTDGSEKHVVWHHPRDGARSHLVSRA